MGQRLCILSVKCISLVYLNSCQSNYFSQPVYFWKRGISLDGLLEPSCGNFQLGQIINGRHLLSVRMDSARSRGLPCGRTRSGARVVLWSWFRGGCHAKGIVGCKTTKKKLTMPDKTFCNVFSQSLEAMV